MSFLSDDFQQANEALERPVTVAARPSAKRELERADTIPYCGAPTPETEPTREHLQLGPYMALGTMLGVLCAEAWWLADKIVSAIS